MVSSGSAVRTPPGPPSHTRGRWPLDLSVPRPVGSRTGPDDGADETLGSEGWHGDRDWSGFDRDGWPDNLPTRFLRRGRLVSCRPDEVLLTHGLHATMEDGLRSIYLHGVRVLHGEAYLLPWRSRRSPRPDKLYHWNPAGGVSRWGVCAPFTGTTAWEQHALTDDGKVLREVVVVEDGRLTLRAEAVTAYVLHPVTAP